MQQAMIYDPFEFAQQLARLGQDGDVTDVLQQPTPEGERARYLKRILFDQRGAERQLVTADDGMIARLQQLAAIAPNFAAAVGVVARAARLSQLSGKPIAVPPILLLGLPGIGKTFWARACAKAIGVTHAEYSMNVQDDPGGLVGHSLSWRAARPGLVARTLLEGPSASPVLLVDEIDKALWSDHGDPREVFHTLFEPENARGFVDAYLETPIRADHVIWLVTANDVGALRPSLVDRLLVLAIDAPSAEQRATVARSIFADLIASYGDPVAADISDDVVEALADAAPRQVRRLMQLALGFAAEARRRHVTPDDVRSASRQLSAGLQRPAFGFRPAR